MQVNEVAKKLGCSRQQVHLWVKAGKLAATANPECGCLIFDAASVEKFAVAHAKVKAYRASLAKKEDEIYGVVK